MLYFPVYSTVGSLEGLSSQLLCSTGTSRTPRGGPELCNVVRHIPWLDVGLLTVPFKRLSQLYLLSWENHAGVVLRCWTCWPERLRYRRADYLFAGNFLLVRRLCSGSLVARFTRSGQPEDSRLHSSCLYNYAQCRTSSK